MADASCCARRSPGGQQHGISPTRYTGSLAFRIGTRFCWVCPVIVKSITLSARCQPGTWVTKVAVSKTRHNAEMLGLQGMSTS